MAAEPRKTATPPDPRLEARFQTARFATSVAELPALVGAPLAMVAELAFVGRSNAGKSTAINVLTNRRRLAFSSKTPGRTQMLNFFALSDDPSAGEEAAAAAYLVDLPGYGYARADEQTRQRWDGLVGGYLRSRRMLRGVVLVMDARRPFQSADEALLSWLRMRDDQDRFRLHLLLTKADQLRSAERRTVLADAERRADDLPLPTSVQLFSALDREGVEELRLAADQILFDAGRPVAA